MPEKNNHGKILVVGPIPPPFGGIPAYVSDLLNSSLKNEFDLVHFNTSIPEQVRTFRKDAKRSYLSFLSDGARPAFLLVSYVLNSFVQYRNKLLYEKPICVHVFTSSY